MRASGTGLLLVACAAALTVGCTTVVNGAPVRSAPGVDDDSRSPIDVDEVLLEMAQMQAITGGGDDLTVIPSMDGEVPVDLDALAGRVPRSWLFAETQTFGPQIEEFHKTTYQNPPRGALISQGAAAYRDIATARHAFESVLGLVQACSSSTAGYVGDATSTADSVGDQEE